MDIRIDQHLSNKLANMSFVCACIIVHVYHQLDVCGVDNIVKLFSNRGIGRCAVPFFFIAAGFFLAGHMGEKGWWGHEFGKRVRSLFVPYVFWNVFYWCFMHTIKVTLSFIGISFAADLGWGLNLGINPAEMPQLTHLWFVRVLLFAVFVSPIFLVLRKKVLGVCCLVAFIVLFQYFAATLTDGIQDWHRSFSIGGWFEGLIYFAIGVYLRHNPIHIARFCVWRKMGRGRYVLCFALAVCPWLLNMWLIRHGFDSVTHRIGMPIVLVSMFFMFEAIPDSPWPKWLTSCSFPIYLIHEAVLVLFAAACRAVGLKGYMSHCSVMFYLLYWAAAVAVSMAITMLIRKNRLLSSVAFGGR